MSVGIFQGDLIIKACIELAIDDIRKNPWLIDDIFQSLTTNPLLKKKYGQKEVDNARNFLMNNNIHIYMSHRLDKIDFPCITVTMGDSYEDPDLATLGDTDVCTEDYTPSAIGKTISYIVPPFTPVSYDASTGIIEIPDTIEQYRYLAAGMLLADPITGNAFIIQGKAGIYGLQIEPNSPIPSGQLAVIPRYPLYRARRERAINKESYNIGCHAHGDVSTLIYLHSIVKYAIYRYREGLFEANGFELSRLKSSDIIKNENLGIENAYSRWITINGQVEESWVKSPQRFIEAIDLIDPDRPNKDAFKSGIQILSNKDTPPNFDETNELWLTAEDDIEQDEED